MKEHSHPEPGARIYGSISHPFRVPVNSKRDRVVGVCASTITNFLQPPGLRSVGPNGSM